MQLLKDADDACEEAAAKMILWNRLSSEFSFAAWSWSQAVPGFWIRKKSCQEGGQKCTGGRLLIDSLLFLKTNDNWRSLQLEYLSCAGCYIERKALLQKSVEQNWRSQGINCPGVCGATRNNEHRRRLEVNTLSIMEKSQFSKLVNLKCLWWELVSVF